MIQDKKIIAADYAGKDIESIEGDYVGGQSTSLKKRFDAVSKDVIAPKHNELIDELIAEGAAAEIGAATATLNRCPRCCAVNKVVSVRTCLVNVLTIQVVPLSS